MLGSHNSMSYLKPIHWWQRWQKPWYRCQEINLVQQYKQGARHFDIRVNLINDCWHYVHNKIDFGYAAYFEELDSLVELAEEEHQEIYFRIILDRRKAPKTKEEQINLVNKFQHLITWLQNAYKMIYNVICIDEVIVYWNWKSIYKNPLHPEIIEYHNSVINKNNLLKYLLGNKYFSKKYNPFYIANHRINDDKFCYLMDFVNIK